MKRHEQDPTDFLKSPADDVRTWWPRDVCEVLTVDNADAEQLRSWLRVEQESNKRLAAEVLALRAALKAVL